MIFKINDIEFSVETYKEPIEEQEALVGINMFEPNNCGVTYRCKGKMFINEEISADQQFITIVHEVTHCYIWAYGFAQIDWKEEIVCDFLAAHCDSIMSDSIKIYNELFKHRRK